MENTKRNLLHVARNAACHMMVICFSFCNVKNGVECMILRPSLVQSSFDWRRIGIFVSHLNPLLYLILILYLCSLCYLLVCMIHCLPSQPTRSESTQSSFIKFSTTFQVTQPAWKIRTTRVLLGILPQTGPIADA